MNALSELMAMTFEQKEVEFKGKTFIVKEMNAKDKTIYENSLYEYKQNGKGLSVTPKMENYKAKLVALTLCDMEGNRVFKGMEDITLIDELPSSFVDAVANAASELSGLDAGKVSKN